MKKNKGKEASVEEASQVLNVTPRTVINYINSKEIEAIKVGKSWFIDRPSLEAFKQRYNLGEQPPPPQGTSSENTEIKRSETRKFPENSARQKKSDPVHTLRLFQIAKETLHNISPKNLLPTDRTDLHEKFLNLKAEAVELLGAGFYSYDNRLKARLYDRARAKVGGMLSLVYFYQKSEPRSSEVTQKIEQELMPAFSSLIRKLEMKGEKTIKKWPARKGEKS